MKGWLIVVLLVGLAGCSQQQPAVRMVTEHDTLFYVSTQEHGIVQVIVQDYDGVSGLMFLDEGIDGGDSYTGTIDRQSVLVCPVGPERGATAIRVIHDTAKEGGC